MRIFYSPGTGGFYSDEWHEVMPLDVIEISWEERLELAAAEATGLRIVAGPDGSPSVQQAPIEELRARKIADIDAARDAAIIAGFEYSGARFDSDAKSIQRISGAVTLSMLNPAYETEWITFDNSTVTLDAAGLAGLGAAAGEHEATQIFKARALKNAVLAATTAEEIQSITW